VVTVMVKTKGWLSELAIIVVGVLAALGVDSAYERRTDARVGEWYELRIAATG